MKKINYSALELIEDLKQDIFKIIPPTLIINGIIVKMIHNGFLSDNKLSLILCDYANRIKRIKRNIRANHLFKIALDELSKWENNIEAYFGLEGKKVINFIKKYRESNEDLPISRKKGLKVLNYHPELKLHYFEKIDNKEKAYWLGLLWAEVYLGERGVIRLELSKNDEILIDRYCKALGLHPKYKKYSTKTRTKGLSTYVRIVFRSIKIQNDLYSLGYVKSSKKSTIFPNLDNRELELAFLLGFFDGDGKEGKTSFHLGSKMVLDQIKEKFSIHHNVYPDKDGKSWYLSLGAKLFNEMMYNYENSLERKRKIFRVSLKESLKNQITKEELEKMVWTMQINDICKKYSVYRRILIDLCDEWNIKRPPSHYWHRKKR